jgi:hypothetical protein
LSQVESFSLLLAMLPLKKTGLQIECLCGLSRLEGAQGLRDLRAKDWAALGGHRGGGRCFLRKRRALSLSRKTDGKLERGHKPLIVNRSGSRAWLSNNSLGLPIAFSFITAGISTPQ